MADKTGIEWTDATWNPTVGCSIVSPGCTNCYAMKMAARLEKMGSPIYRGLTKHTKAGAVWTGKVEMSNWGQVIKPLSWKRPRRIFVNSMSDLFHESLPDASIDKVFAVMALCPQHTFQILTKRAERMRDYLLSRNGMGNASICGAINQIPAQLGNRHGALEMPLPNVWLGVSVEDQDHADERSPPLLATPAAMRFLSCEPLLGPLDLEHLAHENGRADHYYAALSGYVIDGSQSQTDKIDWGIVGGESGGDARPMHPDWARSLRDQCQAAGVPFFFKQWGETAPYDRGRVDSAALANPGALDAPMVRFGKKAAGRQLDGREWSEFPA